MIALLLACLSPLAQGAPTDDGWKPLNRPSLIVNEELITTDEIRRDASLGKQFASEQEFQLAQQRVFRAKVEGLLQAQAGRDLGFPPEQVQRLVEGDLDKQRETFGSTSRLAEALQQEEIDSFTHKEAFRSRVYLQLWRGATTGRYFSPGGRLSRDRWVRPGQIEFNYRARPQAFNRPGRVQLQQALLDLRRGRDVAELQSALEEVRLRVLAGEDLARLAEDSGMAEPGSGGRLDPLETEKLRAFPEVYEWVVGANVGDLSPVLPFTVEGSVRAYLFVKILEKSEPVSGDLESREFQRELQEKIRLRIDEVRINLGLQKLFEGAYIWPPESRAPADDPARS